MNTAKYYLEMLPEPYRSQALSCCNILNNEIGNDRDPIYINVARALNTFMGGDTPHGSMYWDHLFQKVMKHKIKLGVTYSKYLKK